MDYNEILLSCGFGTSNTSVVVKNMAKLEEFYDSEELIGLYNYCLLNINDSELVIHVIKHMDAYKNQSTLEILSNMLKNRIESDNEAENEHNINIRSMCARAIANYKDTSTVVLLLDCLNNKKENYKVRLACADALGRIGDRYAVKPLLDVVEDEDEKSVYLKESATFALGLLGDISAIDPLISILESKQGFLDKFTFLKEKIVEALGKLNLNNRKILKALKHSLMDSSPMVRINAIEAIMNSGEEESAEILKPSLQDEDGEVRKNALVALYNLIGRDILDEVIELPIYPEDLKTEAENLMNEYEAEESDE